MISVTFCRVLTLSSFVIHSTTLPSHWSRKRHPMDDGARGRGKGREGRQGNPVEVAEGQKCTWRGGGGGGLKEEGGGGEGV